MTLQIYTAGSGLKHDTGPGHPEQIARLKTIYELLQEEPYSKIPVIQAEEADTDWIARAHTHDYMNRICDTEPEQGYVDIEGEVIMSHGTWQAALDSAGAACRAVTDVMDGTCTRAFSAARPPGHHALPEKAMGFCFFNNIFIAARHAQEQYGAARVAIVDFDVHHGNGTDYMTKQAENIFFVSSHEWPLWPGTGDPKYDVPGKNLNIPLPAGTDSEGFRAAYEELVFPALDQFKPDLLMVSAGFDAHRDDPLANLMLVEDDYFWITEKLCRIANTHCGGKLVSCLEGGYNLEALKNSVAAHLDALTA